MSDTQPTISPGIYEHYSGKRYQVVGLARHSETLEELVLYRALYDDSRFGDRSYWVRPVAMFTEQVEHNGKRVLRFRPVQNGAVQPA